MKRRLAAHAKPKTSKNKRSILRQVISQKAARQPCAGEMAFSVIMRMSIFRVTIFPGSNLGRMKVSVRSNTRYLITDSGRPTAVYYKLGILHHDYIFIQILLRFPLFVCFFLQTTGDVSKCAK